MVFVDKVAALIGLHSYDGLHKKTHASGSAAGHEVSQSIKKFKSFTLQDINYLYKTTIPISGVV